MNSDQPVTRADLGRATTAILLLANAVDALKRQRLGNGDYLFHDETRDLIDAQRHGVLDLIQAPPADEAHRPTAAPERDSNRVTGTDEQKAYVLKLVRGYRDADNVTDAASDLAALFGWIEVFAASQMAAKPTETSGDAAVRALLSALKRIKRQASNTAIDDHATLLNCIAKVAHEAIAEAQGRKP